MKSTHALKQWASLSTACEELSMQTDEPGWHWRLLSTLTGEEQKRAQECTEKRRIDALLPWPNPMVVLISLLWLSLVGVDTGRTLSQLLGQQSYLVQVVLIVTTCVVFGATAYQLLLAMPHACVRILYARQLAKQRQFEQIQQQMRGSTNYYPQLIADTKLVTSRNRWQTKRLK